VERKTETVSYRCTEKAARDLREAAESREMSPSMFAEKAVSEKVRRTLKWGLSRLKEGTL
jgi:predicted transcriptional regulator